MSYTERFTERWALLATIDPAIYNAEQNTGYVACTNYHRLMINIHAGALAGDLDIDIEEATTVAGGGVRSFDGGGKDVTKTAIVDNDTVSIIEIKGEEFEVNSEYDCINVEVTPAAAGIFGVQVWGLGDYVPVPTTLLDSVTD